LGTRLQGSGRCAPFLPSISPHVQGAARDQGLLAYQPARGREGDGAVPTLLYSGGAELLISMRRPQKPRTALLDGLSILSLEGCGAHPHTHSSLSIQNLGLLLALISSCHFT
jgi:hypothetical protein